MCLTCEQKSCNRFNENHRKKVIAHPWPTVYPKKYAHGFSLLCFVVVIHWLIFPYPSGLLHWHCGNVTIALVPAKQPWWIWINTSCEFIINDCITTTKQSTTKPCAYFLGYTVFNEVRSVVIWFCKFVESNYSSMRNNQMASAWTNQWITLLHGDVITYPCFN